MMAKSGLLRSATPVRSWKYIPMSASSCAKAGVERAADARTAQVIIFFSNKPPKYKRHMTNFCDHTGGGGGGVHSKIKNRKMFVKSTEVLTYFFTYNIMYSNKHY